MKRTLRVTAFRVVAGICAIAIALFAQSRIANGVVPQESVLAYALGALLIVAASFRVDSVVFAGGRLFTPDDGDTPVSRPIRLAKLIALGLSIGTAILGVLRFAGKANEAGWLLHIASVVLLILAFLPESFRPPREFGWKHALGLLLPLSGVLLVALFMRAYLLDQFPFGVWFDEANNGDFARRILTEPAFRPIYADPLQLPAHFSYITAFLFQLFGVNLVSLRLSGVIFGMLTVLFAYLLFSRWFGRPMGLVAAFMFAVARYALPWSRFGMFWGTPPAFELMIVYFLDRALDRKRLADFAWAGLMTGFSLAFYFATRLYGGVLAAFALWLSAMFVVRWLRSRRMKPDIVQATASRAKTDRIRLAGAIAALMLGFLTAIAPVAYFAATNYDTFFLRTATVSIFEKRDEPDLGKALLSQATKHLLMYNVAGDRNGRHNLPGAPMLDAITGALAVLGLAIAVSQIYKPANFLMLSTFGVMMLGGILSLDFEAPQSLRSIGTLPAVIYFAALPVASVWKSLGALSADPNIPSRIVKALSVAPRWIFAIVLVALLSQMGYLNFDAFFNRQRNDTSVWLEHSAPETIVAREINRLSLDNKLVVSASFVGHPTLRFLAPNAAGVQRWTGGEPLEIPPNAQTGLAVLVEPRMSSTFNQLRLTYPNAQFRAITPPNNGDPIVLEAVISPKDLKDAQGVTVNYRDAAAQGRTVKTEAISTLAADWTKQAPVESPFTAEFLTTLSVSQSGSYRFEAGSPNAQLFVDEYAITGDAISLSRGNHPMRLVIPGSATSWVVRWRPPGAAQFQPISPSVLFRPPVSNSGLLGAYRNGVGWTGEPAFTQNDPEIAFYFQNLPLPRPYSIEWTGRVYAPVTGTYRFGTESIDESLVSIDGRQLVENRLGGPFVDAPVQLDQGWHDLNVRFADKTGYTRVYFYWTPPKGGREIVPSRYLSPPMGAYPTAEQVSSQPEPAPITKVSAQNPASKTELSLSGLTSFVTTLGRSDPVLTVPPQANPAPIPGPAKPAPAIAPPAQSQQPEPAKAASLLPTQPPAPQLKIESLLVVGKEGTANGEFKNPRGIAIDKRGRVFIADTDNRRVQVLDSNGGFLFAITGGQQPFEEPFNLGIGSSGDLWVLDSGNGAIVHFNDAGVYLGQLDGRSLGFFKPRGLWLDDGDNLYVADTGGSRVFKLSPTGDKLATIGQKGAGKGGLGEISHAIAASDGSLYVADVTNDRIQQFGANGDFLREFTIPHAGAATGPHFAFAPDGTLIVTAPEMHKLQRFSREGVLIGEYGEFGTTAGKFRLPTGIAMSGDVIWVVETGNHRIQKLKLGN
jgi:sugar lactone lactonase YvrE